MITATAQSSQISSQAVPQIGEITGAPPSKLSSELTQGDAFRAAYAANLGETANVGKGAAASALEGQSLRRTDGSSGTAAGAVEFTPKQIQANRQTQTPSFSDNEDSAVKSSIIGVSLARSSTLSVAAIRAATRQAGPIQDAKALDDRSTTARASQPAVAGNDASQGFVAKITSADSTEAASQTDAQTTAPAADLKNASGETAGTAQAVRDVAAQASTEISAAALAKAKAAEHGAVARNRKDDLAASSAAFASSAAPHSQTVDAAAAAARTVSETSPQPAVASAHLPVLAPGDGQTAILPALSGNAGDSVSPQPTGSTASAAAISGAPNAAAFATAREFASSRGSDASGFGDLPGTSAIVAGVQAPPNPASQQLVGASASNGASTSDAAAQAGRSSDAAGLPNRSSGVSERVPVSIALPGASVSPVLEKSVRQPGAVALKSASESVSPAIPDAPSAFGGSGTRPTPAETSLKPAAASGSGVGLRTRPTTGGGPALVSGSPDPSLAATSASGPVAAVAAARLATDGPPATPHAVGRTAQPAQLAHPAGQAPQATIAASEARERAAKLSGDDRDFADTSAPASGAGVVSVPASASDPSRTAAAALVSAAVSASAAPAPHTNIEAATVPVHSPGPATLAGAATGQATSGPVTAGIGRQLDSGLGGPFEAQSSSASASGDSHRTLLATPTALEVGVPSGTQGWLKIRAEVGGQGEVKASLDAASATGRDLLHSQLPALNAFLHGEHLPVTATVAERASVAELGAGATATGTGGSGNGLGASNGSLLQGDGGQRHSEPGPSPGTIERAGTYTPGYDSLTALSDPAGTGSGLPTGTSAESGRWLNVRV